MDKKEKHKRKNILTPVMLRLLAKAAGRCEFRGCNKLLLDDELTTLKGNFSECAHILPSSPYGPRGEFIHGEDDDMRNSEDNLMLLCAMHHHEIDSSDNVKNFPPALLYEMKMEHEARVRIATQIMPDYKTHVLVYESHIGTFLPQISDAEVLDAIFPDRYPQEPKPTRLSCDLPINDTKDGIWEMRRDALNAKFAHFDATRSRECQHISLFAFAPIPLLIQLGTLLAKINTSVYHPRFRNERWQWKEETPKGFFFDIQEPPTPTELSLEKPALSISISGGIVDERVREILGIDCAIWKISVPKDFLTPTSIQSIAQVEDFKRIFRQVLSDIQVKCGLKTELHIFPAIPVPIAVELGRCRLEKCDMPWTIYDQNPETNAFIKTITIK